MTSAETRRGVRTILFVEEARYTQDYGGGDSLPPEHHLGMIGKQYDSFAEVQADLDRWTQKKATAYASVLLVEITDDQVRQAWVAKAAAYECLHKSGYARRCNRIAEDATAGRVKIDPDMRLTDGDFPVDWSIHRNEIRIDLGVINDFRVGERTVLHAK